MANIKKVLALGFFDSIHIGHRYLLQRAKEIAFRKNTNVLVVTFNDDFLSNLNRPNNEVFLLNERIAILQDLGYNHTLVLNPTKEFLQQTHKEFLQYLLTLEPMAILAGADYRFGKGGKGNIGHLIEFMTPHNIDVVSVDLKTNDGAKVASSGIKQLLADGKIEEANELLGGRYFVSGRVIRGRGEGGQFGIPTANIEIPPYKKVPKAGIYKTATEVNGRIYNSITNVGSHPTFNCNNFNIETMLLAFDDNLYNTHIKIYFDKWIREVIRFKSPQELVAQIHKDIKSCYS